jgi:hypothetical protein
MLTETHDREEIIERIAALDIGKAELMCCVRIPDEERRGRRLQEVQAYQISGPSQAPGVPVACDRRVSDDCFRGTHSRWQTCPGLGRSRSEEGGPQPSKLVMIIRFLPRRVRVSGRCPHFPGGVLRLLQP